jgi:hypothetical protein
VLTLSFSSLMKSSIGLSITTFVEFIVIEKTKLSISKGERKTSSYIWTGNESLMVNVRNLLFFLKVILPDYSVYLSKKLSPLLI